MTVPSAQQWYAIYTQSNSENTLNRQIIHYSEQHQLGYQTFFPVYQEIKHWADRTKKIERPLFRNYLFVKHDLNGFRHIKRFKGFLCYVCLGSAPTVISDDQMSLIKILSERQAKALGQTKKLKHGQRIEVVKGVFKGYKGVLLESVKERFLAIEITSLAMHMTVKLPVNDVIVQY
ncbi:transcription termination/antitermination NusG family protein [Thalassotalea sp. LPB0316]|uniref:UpxY family transcription antiterminator n=1 Tax=Thalassotalea sp. LPB0316 TaxID=2769490 RepID=UPI00186887FC|nr:UpxY family transcription antiterminator [Thalassotalea sp. LPB0316]QOL25215.1 transcription termination/antitermination NusG family protein [Thalassotalea sp. LPB0316]